MEIEEVKLDQNKLNDAKLREILEALQKNIVDLVKIQVPFIIPDSINNNFNELSKLINNIILTKSLLKININDINTLTKQIKSELDKLKSPLLESTINTIKINLDELKGTINKLYRDAASVAHIEQDVGLTKTIEKIKKEIANSTIDITTFGGISEKQKTAINNKINKIIELIEYIHTGYKDYTNTEIDTLQLELDEQINQLRVQLDKISKEYPKTAQIAQELDTQVNMLADQYNKYIPALLNKVNKLDEQSFMWGTQFPIEAKKISDLKERVDDVESKLTTISEVPKLPKELQDLIGTVKKHEESDNIRFAELQGKIDNVDKKFSTLSDIPDLSEQLKGLIGTVEDRKKISKDLNVLRDDAKEKIATLSDDIKKWKENYEEQLQKHRENDDKRFNDVNDVMNELIAKPVGTIDQGALNKQVTELVNNKATEFNTKLENLGADIKRLEKDGASKDYVINAAEKSEEWVGKYVKNIDDTIEKKAAEFNLRQEKLDGDIKRLEKDGVTKNYVVDAVKKIENWVGETAKNINDTIGKEIKTALGVVQGDIDKLFVNDTNQQKSIDEIYDKIDDIFDTKGEQDKRIRGAEADIDNLSEYQDTHTKQLKNLEAQYATLTDNIKELQARPNAPGAPSDRIVILEKQIADITNQIQQLPAEKYNAEQLKKIIRETSGTDRITALENKLTKIYQYMSSKGIDFGDLGDELTKQKVLLLLLAQNEIGKYMRGARY